MIFPYLPVSRHGALRLLPIIPVRLFGSKRQQDVVGVGGAVSRGYLIVRHQLGHHQWTMPVVFSTAVDSPAILGQAGFFEFFTVTFRRRRAIMDIRRAR